MRKESIKQEMTVFKLTQNFVKLMEEGFALMHDRIANTEQEVILLREEVNRLIEELQVSESK